MTLSSHEALLFIKPVPSSLNPRMQRKYDCLGGVQTALSTYLSRVNIATSLMGSRWLSWDEAQQIGMNDLFTIPANAQYFANLYTGSWSMLKLTRTDHQGSLQTDLNIFKGTPWPPTDPSQDWVDLRQTSFRTSGRDRIRTMRSYFSDRAQRGSYPQDSQTSVAIRYAGIHIPDNTDEAMRDYQSFTQTIYDRNRN